MTLKRIIIDDVIGVLRGRAIGVDRSGTLYCFVPDYPVRDEESKVRLMRESVCRAEWLQWKLLDIQPTRSDLEETVIECKALMPNWRRAREAFPAGLRD
jgi:hypothetical protein